jgi:hypothetical protein
MHYIIDMDANALCACGSSAIRFCTCQTPSKLYLCSLCLNKHVTSPGAHSFFDLKVKDLLDPYLHNLRSNSTVQFLTRMDEVKALLYQELGTVDEVIKELYNKHCEELLQKYRQASVELYGVYQKMLNSLSGVEAEIATLETDLRVKLSVESKQFCQWCWHVGHTPSSVLNQRTEVANFIKGKQRTTAEDIFAAWSCSQADCVICVGKEIELSLNLSPPQAEVIKLTSCEKCESAMQVTDTTCAWCGWTKAAQSSAEASKTPDQLIWACPHCGYEYNFMNSKECTRCSYKLAA